MPIPETKQEILSTREVAGDSPPSSATAQRDVAGFVFDNPWNNNSRFYDERKGSGKPSEPMAATNEWLANVETVAHRARVAQALRAGNIAGISPIIRTIEERTANSYPSPIPECTITSQCMLVANSLLDKPLIAMRQIGVTETFRQWIPPSPSLRPNLIPDNEEERVKRKIEQAIELQSLYGELVSKSSGVGQEKLMALHSRYTANDLQALTDLLAEAKAFLAGEPLTQQYRHLQAHVASLEQGMVKVFSQGLGQLHADKKPEAVVNQIKFLFGYNYCRGVDKGRWISAQVAQGLEINFPSFPGIFGTERNQLHIDDPLREISRQRLLGQLHDPGIGDKNNKWYWQESGTGRLLRHSYYEQLERLLDDSRLPTGADLWRFALDTKVMSYSLLRVDDEFKAHLRYSMSFIDEMLQTHLPEQYEKIVPQLKSIFRDAKELEANRELLLGTLNSILSNPQLSELDKQLLSETQIWLKDWNHDQYCNYLDFKAQIISLDATMTSRLLSDETTYSMTCPQDLDTYKQQAVSGLLGFDRDAYQILLNRHKPFLKQQDGAKPEPTLLMIEALAGDMTYGEALAANLETIIRMVGRKRLKYSENLRYDSEAPLDNQLADYVTAICQGVGMDCSESTFGEALEWFFSQPHIESSANRFTGSQIILQRRLAMELVAHVAEKQGFLHHYTQQGLGVQEALLHLLQDTLVHRLGEPLAEVDPRSLDWLTKIYFGKERDQAEYEDLEQIIRCLVARHPNIFVKQAEKKYLGEEKTEDIERVLFERKMKKILSWIDINKIGTPEKLAKMSPDELHAAKCRYLLTALTDEGVMASILNGHMPIPKDHIEHIYKPFAHSFSKSTNSDQGYGAPVNSAYIGPARNGKTYSVGEILFIASCQSVEYLRKHANLGGKELKNAPDKILVINITSITSQLKAAAWKSGGDLFGYLVDLAISNQIKDGYLSSYEEGVELINRGRAVFVKDEMQEIITHPGDGELNIAQVAMQEHKAIYERIARLWQLMSSDDPAKTATRAGKDGKILTFSTALLNNLDIYALETTSLAHLNELVNEAHKAKHGTGIRKLSTNPLAWLYEAYIQDLSWASRLMGQAIAGRVSIKVMPAMTQDQLYNYYHQALAEVIQDDLFARLAERRLATFGPLRYDQMEVQIEPSALKLVARIVEEEGHKGKKNPEVSRLFEIGKAIAPLIFGGDKAGKTFSDYDWDQLYLRLAEGSIKLDELNIHFLITENVISSAISGEIEEPHKTIPLDEQRANDAVRGYTPPRDEAPFISEYQGEELPNFFDVHGEPKKLPTALPSEEEMGATPANFVMSLVPKEHQELFQNYYQFFLGDDKESIPLNQHMDTIFAQEPILAGMYIASRPFATDHFFRKAVALRMAVTGLYADHPNAAQQILDQYKDLPIDQLQRYWQRPHRLLGVIAEILQTEGELEELIAQYQQSLSENMMAAGFDAESIDNGVTDYVLAYKLLGKIIEPDTLPVSVSHATEY